MTKVRISLLMTVLAIYIVQPSLLIQQRRNKIGNHGAFKLADWIKTSDKTLISIELERNKIQDEGGEALLIAT